MHEIVYLIAAIIVTATFARALFLTNLEIRNISEPVHAAIQIKGGVS